MSKNVEMVLQEMLPYLNNKQLEKLRQALHKYIQPTDSQDETRVQEEDLISQFLTAKQLEGCSSRTVKFYEQTLRSMERSIPKNIREIDTADVRLFMNDYSKNHSVGRVTMDNMRRIMSSFFGWLESEDIILKSPLRRIHKVKAPKNIKQTFSDEELELLKEASNEARNKAIINLLASTGIRVGELVRIKISDVNFQERECVVLGKGDKARTVYFDARTKICLENYLRERKGKSPYLFTALRSPYKRLGIGGVETLLRSIGKIMRIEKVHPHKFRRSMATLAIDKGMPIEQVQHLLGHQRIDTTLQYAMVKQSNVKSAHKKYLC
jgi:site-specific recombinase XerD